MFGEPLLNQVPVLRAVLKRGASRSGVWQHEDKLLQVGVAAVRNDQGGVVGALLVGYDLSNGFAKQEAALIGHDLLFIMPERIYSTSTPVDVRDALQGALYSSPLDSGTNAALQGKPTLPWTATLAGDEYVGVTAALPMARGVEAGYVVLAHHGKHTALAGVATMILWLTLLGLLGVAIYGFIIANNIMEPIEQMEDDILARRHQRPGRRSSGGRDRRAWGSVVSGESAHQFVYWRGRGRRRGPGGDQQWGLGSGECLRPGTRRAA
jgi:hypothetical protein